ncbi:MAG: hypothetical protein AAFY31_00490 [Pseudomonadota bacterium]
MLRGLALLLIGVAFGGGAGFVLGSGGGVPDTPPAMDHAQHMHAHGEGLVIEPGPDAPTLSLAVAPDPVAGWNLHLATTNFVFAAERAGEAHIAGEGHAHVYVNGEKIARAYGNWFHLESLPQGQVEIEVTLNSNDHRAFLVGDVPLSATVSFDNLGS